MNYLFFGGLFSLRYAYVDLNVDSGYVADSLFYRRKIRVWFLEEAVKDDDKYRLIFCRIRKKDKQRFEEALSEIRTKMAFLGHNDYDDYCDELMRRIEGFKDERSAEVLSD